MLYVKEFPTRVKAAGEADGLEKGQVRAIVSVFGNVDSYGDVVMPGAFTEDLQAWKESGDPIPAIWSHDWRDPYSHIGPVLEAVEVEKGLEVLYQCDLDNPKAAQVYRLLKGRRVTQSSFAYDVIDSGWAKRTDEATGKDYEVYELRKLHLFEIGPTLVGANQETELLAVKSGELARSFKSGRVMSHSSLTALRKAHEQLGQVLDSAQTDEHRASGVQPEKAATAVDSAKQTGHADGDPAEDQQHDGAAKSSAQGAPNGTAQALAWLQLS